MAQTTEKAPATGAGNYLEKFNHFEGDTHQPGWLQPMRQAGISRFAELGFPTLHDEDWRFTNAAPLARLPFKPVLVPADVVSSEALNQFAFAGLTGARLVFVNGHFAQKLSSVSNLPAGVKVTSLAAALTADAAFLEKHLGHYTQTADNGFTALNQAFFQDGGFVHVSAGTIVQKPIQFVYVSTSERSGATFLPRNLVIS